MSRRFSNLQYVTIGILFGTCVFLWAKKLNLTKAFTDNHHASSLHKATEGEDSDQLVDSWAEKLELKKQRSAPNVEDVAESEEANINDEKENEHIYHPKGLAAFLEDSNKQETVDKTDDVAEEVASAEVDKLETPSTSNLSIETELSPPVESPSDPLTTTEGTVDSSEEVGDVSSTPAKALDVQSNSTTRPTESSTVTPSTAVHPTESSTATPPTTTLLSTEDSVTEKSKL